MDISEEKFKEFKNLKSFYCKENLSIIPLATGSKIPSMKWKEFQERLPNLQEIDEWFREFQNIAIITGKLSNLCVIDIDESTPEANELISKLPVTLTVETGNGGLHYYFRYPKDKVLPNFCRRIPGVDFRGEGGYVLAPPSIHPNGNGYKFTYVPESWDEIPQLPYELLESCFEDGTANKGKIQDILESEQIPIGQRNSDLYLIAQQIHAGLPKQSKLAWQLFKAFAKDKCASTYEEAYVKGELGSIFNSAGTSRIASESLEQYESANEPGTWMNPIPGDVLYDANFPPVEWIVDKLFLKSGIGMLSGDPASYKTFLFLDLAAAIAQGEPWLGKFETKKNKVWIMDKESNLNNLQKRLHCLKSFTKEAGKDISFSCDQIITVHKDGKLWDQTLEKAAEAGVGVLIMDSFRRFLPGSENDSEITNNFFSQIAKCRTFGISVLFTHHHRKKVKDIAPDASQMIRGSSDILSNLDMHLVVEKSTENNGLLKMTANKVKEGEEMEPFAVKRMTENNMLYFVHEGAASNFIFDNKPRESDKASKAIIEILKENPLGLTKAKIDEFMLIQKFTKNATTEGLKTLKRQEFVLEENSGLPGKDYQVNYFLAKTP